MCVCWHAIPKYQYLFRVLIARMAAMAISSLVLSFGRNDDSDHLLARSRSTYRESPLIKIYARLGKRRGAPIRLPSYIKCHRALSRFYSWVQGRPLPIGTADQLSPNLIPLIRRSCAAPVRRRCTKNRSAIWRAHGFRHAATLPFHFPPSPSRSDFILSPR